MYIYATMEGGIYRFSTISWIEWLKHMRDEGARDISRYAKHLGNSEGEMIDWGKDEINYALELIAVRKQKKRSAG